jgi:endonuclease/exonuclease/phosphatase (EEP) superfamily protein YafD
MGLMLIAWARLLLLSAASTPALAGAEYRLIAFNVQFDAPSVNVQQNIALLRGEAADIVCLEEVTPAFAKMVETQLADVYPYRAFKAAQGTWGVGIASKYPIAEFTTFPQIPHRMPAATAKVVLPDRRVTVVCVHLFPPAAKRNKERSLLETLSDNAELREKQSTDIARRYANEPGPVVIAGDFNEGPTGGAILALAKKGFQSACTTASAACGATWPGASSSWPALIQIDHIFGVGVVFTAARVFKGGGSDHYPIAASFRLDRRE